MIKNYFSLAMSDLRHRGLRSWLTLLGIFIGIAAVVSLITLGSGLERAITGQFGGLSLDVLTIQNKQTGFAPPGSAVVEKLNNNDLKIIEEVSGVRNTITRLIRVTSVEYNKVSRFVYVGDLPQDEEDADVVYDVIDARIGEGRLLRNDDKSKIMLGSEIAKENVFGKKVGVGSKLKINGRNFEVIGILEPASTFAVNGAILMPNRDMKETLGIGDEYDLIVAKVHEEDNIEKVASEIEKKMRKDRNEKFGEESFSVETPLQALESVSTILDIVNIIVVGIGAISLFVGGIGIANTMFTSVLERTKDIGVMKAVGAKNKDIMMIFLIEAGLFGLIGGVVGAVIGIGAALGVSAMANRALGVELLAAEISYPLLIGAVVFSFFIGVLSGITPARRASRLNVVEALRK